MKIGIDKISFFTPSFFVDMKELAIARKVDPNKYILGLGQKEMSFAPLTQDTVTMAANAALNILDENAKKDIDLVILGTESGIDNSKAASIYVHNLLGLQPYTRTIEIKQACYGATAGLKLAKYYLEKNPNKKVLVLASDIAKYGLNSSGEPTQGAGAVAMLITTNPQCASFSEDSVYLTNDIMDFWRPLYLENALVDGHFSNEQYLSFFNKLWANYKEKNKLTLTDFKAFCFHLPYIKIGRKTLANILNETSNKNQKLLLENFDYSSKYNQRVGNIYTGSLYLSLISLLENQKNLSSEDKIAMFSYGSGAVGEIFSLKLEKDFQKTLLIKEHNKILNDRKILSIKQYEQLFKRKLPKTGNTYNIKNIEDPATIFLSGIKNHMRQYKIKTKK